MQLYIMRHGEASMNATSDAQRPLTKQGQLEASLMAKWLCSMQVSFDQVMVSPYLRAQQTSTLLLSTLADSAQATTLDIITPSDCASNVHDYIDGLYSKSKFQQLLMISHMPLVSYLVAELTVDHQAPIFQTATIAQIDYDPKAMKGRLVRLISPLDLC